MEGGDEEGIVAISLLGVMNPAIHHPVWYEKVDLLAADECKEAMGKNVVCTSNYSAFELSDILVQCQRDEWRVEGPRRSATRLINLCGHVFDEQLTHTPGSEVRLSIQVHRATSASNVAERIAEVLGRIERWRKFSSLAHEVHVSTQTAEGRIETSIEPSVIRDDMVYVAVMARYAPDSFKRDGSNFLVRDDLLERWPDFKALAEETIAAVVEELNDV